MSAVVANLVARGAVRGAVRGAALAIPAFAPAAWAQEVVASRVVFKTNAFLPGTNFIPFSLGQASIADDGRLCFSASGNPYSLGSVVVGTQAGVSVIVGTGDAAPGVAGGVLNRVGGPRMSPNGKVVFEATLTGPSFNTPNDDVSYVGTPGGMLFPYYRDSVIYPPMTQTFGLSNSPFVVNDAGSTIHPIITGVGSGIKSVNRVDQSGARTGFTVLGETNQYNLPAINASDYVAACILGPALEGYLTAAPLQINLFSSTHPTLIASVGLTNQQDFAYFYDRAGGGTSGPSISLNNARQIVFGAERYFGDGSRNNVGILNTFGTLNTWSPTQGLRELRRDGAAAPGGGTFDFGYFTNADLYRINAKGTFTFVAANGPRPRVFGDPAPSVGLYVSNWDGTQMWRVMLQDQVINIPGFGQAGLSAPSSVFINEQGTVVFATVAGGRQVLLRARATTNYALELIAWGGQAVAVASGDIRVVSSSFAPLGISTALGSSGGQDGNGTLINRRGQIVYAVAFEFFNGSAIMTVNGACPADFNADDQVDFFDYLDFAASFSTEDPSADFNADGQVDFFDYLDFSQAFDAGC
ncbi:MAG: hypothetical protein SFZ23_14665 [Planctomycetota bacterium]|nr:hypothetical protein [Planctomycetota bacterium]